MTPADPPQELTARFGDYLSEARSAEWQALRQSLAIGASVAGSVIFRPPFAVFLDVGWGFPAILLATRFSPNLDSPDSLPPFGQFITGCVLRFSDSDRQIALQQP